LTKEFGQFVFDHPEVDDQLPDGAFVYFEVEGETDFNEYSRALADRQDDPSMRVDGDLQLGASLGFLGELQAGIDHLEAAIVSFEAHDYRPSRLRVGSDPRVPCLTTSALFFWLLGHPDRSLERASRAVELAVALEHPLTHAYALFHSGLLHLWRREPELVRVRALGTLEIADDHELQVWTATGTFLLGAALTGLGEVEEGLSGIREGMGLYQGMKTPPVFWPILLCICADACGKAGLEDEGLAFVDEAVALVGVSSTMPLLPELLLVKGDLLTAAGRASDDGAALWYRRALESARALDARMSQLRAATRLCRGFRGTSEAEQSRRQLESVYATFTEGFTTVDLVEARDLIDG
jgi:hypothetical protein